MQFCPVCMLRKSLAGKAESGEPSGSEDTVLTTLEPVAPRFEHYALLMGRLEIQIHGWNGVGEGREACEAGRAPANLIGAGRSGASPKSTWSTRRTVARAFPPGVFARTRCLQYGALRDYHANAGR